MLLRSAGEIFNYFKSREIDKEYLLDHLKRYEFLLKKVDKIIKHLQGKQKRINILDIGPAFQTEILRLTLAFNVDSVGFSDKRVKIRPQDKHYQFNLNDAQYTEKWPKIKKYDIVIMAEVIEHLYTSPKLTLKCISTWVSKNGFLIIQTPNAVSLNRRVKMLVGENPYEMIRETHLNPGHFREYTIEELINLGKEAGFKVYEINLENYFRHKGIKGNIYNLLCNFLPSSFKDGITICLKKTN